MNRFIKGILKVGDLLDENKETLLSDTLKDKYNMSETPFMDYYSLRGSLDLGKKS
jgi:hypothetical protein